MAQKRKNEDISDTSMKRRKGELPIVKIEGITMAIPHSEMIASALRVKGLHPAVPFVINKQTGEAIVQLKSKADQMKLIRLGSVSVNGLELKVKELPPKSCKLYGLRDSFVWRNESQCFFEAATGLCFDPGQGIYLFWDSANQVYTRVQGDATKPPIGPPARTQPPIQQQYSINQQAQVWAGQAQINTPTLQQHNLHLINSQKATSQQSKVQQMVIEPQAGQMKPSKEVEKELKSIKVKLEIEKNASNFLRKHVNQITKEKNEACKLVKDKDQVITKLSTENQRQKQSVERLEKTSKSSTAAAAQDTGEMKREVERLKELEKKHTEGKKQLQEALKQMRTKEKAKKQEMKELKANNAQQVAEKENQILQLKQLLDQAQKNTEAAALAKIQMLESEKIKWKSTCDKLSNELTEKKNELNKEQEKNIELLAKIEELEKAHEETIRQQVTIPPNLPPPPATQPLSPESKPLIPTPHGTRKRNEMRANEAEVSMRGLRQKLEGTEELFADVRDRLGKLKNTVKLNSIQVEQNVICVKPKFVSMLEVLKQVSGICSQATQDLLNFNETALSTDDSVVMSEISELNLRMTEVTSSMKELDQSFINTQPTFGILVGEVEHQKAVVAELKKKLKEAKKAVLEEKTRRETAEDVKEDISELKKLIKKKKRRRRSYSPSGSSSSPSYRGRR